MNDFPLRYKCKECQIEVFHDRSGIEAHMERHPKLTLETYSEKYERPIIDPKVEKRGKETERITEKASTQVKTEVGETNYELADDKKVKVKPSSPAKSIMSNSSSNPGMIKVKLFHKYLHFPFFPILYTFPPSISEFTIDLKLQMRRCPKCDFQTDEAGMIANLGAIHLTKVHKLTSQSMRENPKQWKFKTVKVSAS